MEAPFLCEFAGTVKRGKGLGHTLGFPTANLAIEEALRLRHGVYAARMLAKGEWYAAVVNIGRHPTLPEGPPTVEVHVPGHMLSLYGEAVGVRLVRFLRPERRFDSVEALRAQIRRDIAAL